MFTLPCGLALGDRTGGPVLWTCCGRVVVLQLCLAFGTRFGNQNWLAVLQRSLYCSLHNTNRGGDSRTNGNTHAAVQCSTPGKLWRAQLGWLVGSNAAALFTQAACAPRPHIAA